MDKEMNETVGSTLVFFLGTSDYKPVHYEIGGHRSARPERFVQAALVELLARAGEPVGQAVALVTEAAERTHGAELSERFRRLGVDVRFQRVDEGKSETELWHNFSILGDVLSAGGRIVMDITHGFRSLSITGMLAFQFFRHLRGVELAGLYYGAFEASSPESVPGNAESKTTPIFDLTAMFELPDWSEAFALWRMTGRADAVAKMGELRAQGVRRQLRAERPRELTELPAAMQRLDAAIRLVRHDQIGLSAQNVLGLLNGAEAQAGQVPAMAPYAALAAAMKSDVEALRGERRAGPTDADYLTSQAHIAEWLVDRGRLGESYTLLRELLTSGCVALVAKVGITEVKGRGGRPADWNDGEFRDLAEQWVARLSRADLRARGGERGQCAQEAAVQRALLPHAAVKALYAAAYNALDARNRINHAWQGSAHEREAHESKSADDYQKKARHALGAVQKFVDAVLELALDGQLVRDMGQRETPASQPLRRCFVNLSNHASAGWSEAQTNAALALGHGPVEDLVHGMPLVEPQLDEAAVEALAEAIAERAVSQGAQGALVATDYSLTLCLVAALQCRGVECYAATSSREVVANTDGEGRTVKNSVYAFCRWRRYSKLV